MNTKIQTSSWQRLKKTIFRNNKNVKFKITRNLCRKLNYLNKMFIEIMALKDFCKTYYSRVFGIANHKFDVSFSRQKMSDPIWSTFFQVQQIRLKLFTQAVFRIADYKFHKKYVISATENKQKILKKSDEYLKKFLSF